MNVDPKSTMFLRQPTPSATEVDVPRAAWELKRLIAHCARSGGHYYLRKSLYLGVAWSCARCPAFYLAEPDGRRWGLR